MIWVICLQLEKPELQTRTPKMMIYPSECSIMPFVKSLVQGIEPYSQACKELIFTKNQP